MKLLPLLAAALTLLLAPAASADRLFQVPGAGGCVVPGAVAGCTQYPVGRPYDVVVRADKVYVSAQDQNLIRIYDRDPVTGELKKPAANSPANCIAHDGPGTGCADTKALQEPSAMELSPDGSTLYVTTLASNSVVALTVNGDGTLTHKSCIARAAIEDCALSPILDASVGIAVSADGQDVYVSGYGRASLNGEGNGFITLLNVVGDTLVQHSMTSGQGGCYQHTPQGGICDDARALGTAEKVAISPDGKDVYVSANTSDAVAVFRRGAGGALQQPVGEDGCVQKTATAQAETSGCRTTELIPDDVVAVAFPGDGFGFVGSVGYGVITTLQRNPQTGGLTTPGACIGSTQSGALAGCGKTHDQFGIWDFAVWPDGRGLVSGARFGRGVTGYKINPDGSLAYSPAPGGCLATGGINFTTPCPMPRGFTHTYGQEFGALAVDTSQDGRFLYATSIATFEDGAGLVGARRDAADPVCQDATLSVSAGQQVGLPLSCSDADGDPLTLTVVSTPAKGVTGALDPAAGTVPYAAPTEAGRQTLTFKATSNGVDSNVASVHVDVSASPPGGGGGGGTATERIRSLVRAAWALYHDGTTQLTLFVVRSVPAGAKVSVRCRGKGCPFKKTRSFKPRKGKVVATKFFRKKRFKTGNRLETRITRSGAIGKLVTYRFRRVKAPARSQRCLPVGSTKPRRTC